MDDFEAQLEGRPLGADGTPIAKRATLEAPDGGVEPAAAADEYVAPPAGSPGLEAFQKIVDEHLARPTLILG